MRAIKTHRSVGTTLSIVEGLAEHAPCPVAQADAAAAASIADQATNHADYMEDVNQKALDRAEYAAFCDAFDAMFPISQGQVVIRLQVG